jgi:hypothetical protein
VTGPATAAWALAAATAAAMVTLSGTPRTVVVLVLVLAQLGVQVLATRARGPSSWRRIAGLWSVEAGVTWSVAGEPTTTSALVYLATGLVFALVADVVLRLLGRFTDDGPEAGPEPARTDTAPLPVHDGEA